MMEYTLFKVTPNNMFKIITLRLSLLTFVSLFAAVLLVTISPVANVLHASPMMMFSGSTTVQPAPQKPVPTAKKAAASSKKGDKLDTPKRAQAIFAMGCFWCAESDFEKIPGVIDVISGYTGGTTKNPTYEQVSYRETGHYEAVLVTYDPTIIRYGQLLKTFWSNVDPFDSAGQFCDKGTSYRAAIFPAEGIETIAAHTSRDYLVGHFKRDLATKILPKAKFFPAEDYHQDYYKKNSIRYNLYRKGCGRDDRLESIWGKKR